MSKGEFRQDESWCLFQNGERSFAVPARSVRSVAPAPEITRLSLSDSCLAGLTILHKEILPVFELDRLSPSSGKGNRQVLVINSDTGGWAILIDRVLGLENIEVSFTGIRNETAVDGRSWEEVVVASASIGDRFVSVLDTDLLHEVLRSEVNGYWSSLEGAGSAPGDASSPLNKPEQAVAI